MAAARSDLPTDDYILGRTSEEYQRLRWQARLWEPTTARVLDRAGVAAGMRCLDVGCGPGEVMRLLAERVGPSGRVTGVDNDGRLGREALEVLRATQPDPDRFAFVEADVDAVEEVPGQPFDLVYARLLLSHLRDPVAALRKLGGWTRPGGVVVVQDFDAHTVAVWPELASWGEFVRVISGTYQKTGRDLRLGSKLPLHFAAAGLGAPDGTDVAGLLLPAAELGRMYQGVYRSLLPIALRLGVTTEAHSQAFLAEIAKVSAGRSHVVLSPLLVGAWKRREEP